jgi:hypothetical protein
VKFTAWTSVRDGGCGKRELRESVNVPGGVARAVAASERPDPDPPEELSLIERRRAALTEERLAEHFGRAGGELDDVAGLERLGRLRPRESTL